MKLRKEIKVGIFAILVLGGLYWGVNFLKGKDLLTSDATYYAIYDEVPDLSTAAPIFMKGVRVGLVNKITFDPTKSDDIVVALNIKKRYAITKGSKAVLISNGLLAGKAIRIDLATDTEQELMHGDTLASGMQRDIVDIATSEITFFKDMLSDLTENLNKTLTTLHDMMEANESNIRGTIGNLNHLSGNLNDMVVSQKRGISSIVSNVDQLTTTLKDNSSRFDNIVRNVDNMTDSLSRAGLPQMVAKMDDAAGQLNVLLESINQSQGTIGLLVNDRQLYDSLTRVTSDLSLLIEDVKAHPKRYLKFSVF